MLCFPCLIETNLPRMQGLLQGHPSARCHVTGAPGLADQPDRASGASEALLRQAPFQSLPAALTEPRRRVEPHPRCTDKEGRGGGGGGVLPRSGQAPRCCLFTAETVTPVIEKDWGLVSACPHSGITAGYKRASGITLNSEPGRGEVSAHSPSLC